MAEMFTKLFKKLLFGFFQSKLHWRLSGSELRCICGLKPFSQAFVLQKIIIHVGLSDQT